MIISEHDKKIFDLYVYLPNQYAVKLFFVPVAVKLILSEYHIYQFYTNSN